MSHPAKHPAQQPLPFAEGEATRADRRNLLGAALAKVRCDARLSRFCEWVFNSQELSGENLVKSYDQLASRPWNMCCERWEAREVVTRAKRLGLIATAIQRHASGLQRPNGYTIDWEGVRSIVTAKRVAPLPPAPISAAACSHLSSRLLLSQQPPAPISAAACSHTQQPPAPISAGGNCYLDLPNALPSGAPARALPFSPLLSPSLPYPLSPANAAGGEGLEVLVAIWNQLPEVGKVERLSKARRQAWRNRLADVHFREHWREALARFPLRCFSEPGGWRPTLDWFLRPDTAGKILEGAFDFAKSGNGRSAGRKFSTGPGQVHPDDLARSKGEGKWI